MQRHPISGHVRVLLLLAIASTLLAGCAADPEPVPAASQESAPEDATAGGGAAGESGQPGEPGAAGEGCDENSVNVASGGACDPGEPAPESSSEGAAKGGEGGEGCSAQSISVASKGSCEDGQPGKDGNPGNETPA